MNVQTMNKLTEASSEPVRSQALNSWQTYRNFFTFFIQGNCIVQHKKKKNIRKKSMRYLQTKRLFYADSH